MTTEVEAPGEIVQGDGDEKKTQDRALGKDGMKRRGKGRRGTCKGKGGEGGRSAGGCTWEAAGPESQTCCSFPPLYEDSFEFKRPTGAPAVYRRL